MKREYTIAAHKRSPALQTFFPMTKINIQTEWIGKTNFTKRKYQKEFPLISLGLILSEMEEKSVLFIEAEFRADPYRISRILSELSLRQAHLHRPPAAQQMELSWNSHRPSKCFLRPPKQAAVPSLNWKIPLYTINHVIITIKFFVF